MCTTEIIFKFGHIKAESGGLAMKSKRPSKIKPLVSILILISAVVMLFTLTSCQDTQIDAKSIEIVSDTVPGIAVAGQVELSSIKVKITDQNDQVQEIALTESMLDAASKALLTQTGEKTLNVYYKDCATTFTIYLVEEGTETVRVTFLAKDGSGLGVKYAVKDGKITPPTAPEISGLIFDGWKNQTTNENVNLDSVGSDMTVYASYVQNANKYTVTFVDYKGELVKTVTDVPYGSTIDLPAISLPPELESATWNWDESTPITQNRRIEMIYKYKTRIIDVKYVYTEEDGAIAYDINFQTAVRYGQAPSENFLNDAKKEIAAKKKTFKKWLNLKNIEKNTSSTLYALVEASDCLIQYKNGEADNVTVKAGEEYTFPSVSQIIKTGYAFSKWKDQDGNFYQAGKKYIIENSITITGIYSAQQQMAEFKFTFSPLKDNVGNVLSYTVDNKKVYYDNIVDTDFLSEILKELKKNHKEIAGFLVNIVKFQTKDGFILVNSAGQKIDDAANHNFEIECIDYSLGSAGLLYEEVASEAGNYYKITGYQDSSEAELNIVIPNDYTLNGVKLAVKEIASGSFENKDYAIRLTLGDNVAIIGENAFNGMTFLDDINLNNVAAIGKNAFANCNVVSYENGEKTVYKYVKLTGGKITAIAEGAFNNFKGLQEVILPDTVTEIGFNAFNGCSDLTSINLNSVVTVKEKAFYGCEKLVNASLGKVTILEAYAFAGTGIAAIDLPVIIELDKNALSNMSKLESIKLASASDLGESGKLVFDFANLTGDTALTTLILGDMLTEITNSALDQMGNLIVDTIDFGKVACIDAAVFNGLKRLKTVSVSDAEHTAAFEYEQEIIYTTYKYTVINGVIYAKTKLINSGNSEILSLIYYPSAFYGDYEINEATVAVYAESIKYAHFNRLVIPQALIFVALENVADQTTVTELCEAIRMGEDMGIGADVDIIELSYATAIKYTENLESYDFVIFDKLFNSDSKVFINDYDTCCGQEGDENFETNIAARNEWKASLDTLQSGRIIVKESDIPYYYDSVNSLLYTVKDNKATVISGDKASDKIIIPAKLGGYDVVNIANNAFKNYEYLVSLEVRATLDKWNMIGAFDGCTKLTKLELTDIKEKEEVNYDLLNDTQLYKDNIVIVRCGILLSYNKDYKDKNGNNVTEIKAENLQGLTKIPKGIFSKYADNESERITNNVLTSISLPDSVLEIEEYAFYGCSALKAFDTKNVTKLGQYAFMSCTALAEVKIEKAINGVSTNDGKLPVGIFYECTKLIKVEMDNVNGFGHDNYDSYAFYNCKELADVSFLSHFSGNFYKHAFEGCANITEIEFSGNIQKLYDQAFYNCDKLTHITLQSTVSYGNEVFDECDNLKTIKIKGTGGIFTEPVEGEEEVILSNDVFSGTATIFVDAKVIDRAKIVLANYKDMLKVEEPRITYAMMENYAAGNNSLGKPQESRVYFAAEPKSVEFDGYIFVGWYKGNETDGFERVEFPFTVTENITLKAKYYDKNKGGIKDTDLEKINDGYRLNSYSDNDIICHIPAVYIGSDGTNKNIIEINLDAFDGKDFTTLIIPEGVKKLSGKLQVSAKLAEGANEIIKIAASVKEIADGAFSGCENLDIEWADNSNLVSAAVTTFVDTNWYENAANTAKTGANNGFIIAGRLAIKFVGIDNESNKSIIVPTYIIKLNNGLFKDNKVVERVTLNNSLTMIGKDVFTGATKLKTISYETEAADSKLISVDLGDINNGNDKGIGIIDTPWYTDQNAVILGTIYARYKDKYGDTSVTIPSYITKISDYAFYQATAETIEFAGNKITDIGNYAFACSKITEFTMPASVKNFGIGIFSGCADLATFDASGNSNMEILPENMFGKYEEDVVCGSLTEVILNDSVKKLGTGSFWGSDNITELTAEGISEGGDNIALSGILDTAWAKKSGTEDTHIILGSVYLKYTAGTDTKSGDGDIEVSVREGITIIYQNAFSLDSASKTLIKKVILPASLERIGRNAFYGCTSLEEITFGGNKLIVIEANAFRNTSIMDLTLPNSITTIGDNAFMDTKLSKITIPDSVTEIGTESFADIDGLSEVTLGKGIKIINKRAFANNASLIKINWAWDIDTVKQDGKDTTTIKQLFDFANEVPVVAKAIKLIGGMDKVEAEINKMLENGEITEEEAQILKDKYAEIEDKILELMNEGEGIERDEAVKKYCIDYISEIFAECNGGIAIRMYVPQASYNLLVADSINYISYWNGASTFSVYKEGEKPQVSFDGEGYIKEALNTELIESVEDLGAAPIRTDHTFVGWYEDEDFTKVLTFPYVVKVDIELYAKWYNNNWDSDHEAEDNLLYLINSDNTAYTIVGWDEGTTADNIMYIPNKVNGLSVNAIEINDESRDNAKNIKKIVFTQASNFTDLSENIFTEFTGLEEVELYDSNTNNIRYKVDIENKALYSVDGKVLVAVFKKALLDDKGKAVLDKNNNPVYRTAFTVPEKVVSILPYAFKNSEITSVELSKDNTNIGKSAFSDGMTSISFGSGMSLINVDKESFANTKWYKTVSDTDNSTAGKYYRVDNSIVGYFYSAANVLLEYREIAATSSLILPDEMKGVPITVLASNFYSRGEDKYDEESGIQTQYVSENGFDRDPYVSIKLPNALIRINSAAFAMKCSNGQYENDIVDYLNADNFDGSGCKNTLTYIADDVFGKTRYYMQNNGWVVLGKVLLGYRGTATAVDLNDLKGSDGKKLTIETIAKGAFKGSQITSITLQDSIKIIGAEAFSSSNLSSIIIPKNVTEIGEKAFLNCQKLTKVTYAGEALVTLGDYIFSGCYLLDKMPVPYTVETIGTGAFTGCTNLTNVYFDTTPVYGEDPDTHKQVIVGWHSDNLSKLKTLGSSAFAECTSLKEIKIPNELTSIRESTFAGCSSLVTVEFETDKSMVKTIEQQAFRDCLALGGTIDVNNPSLITLELPNRLTTVGKEAFYGCSSLYGVLFNYNIASIGENAFGACTYLAKIQITAANAPMIENNSFARKNQTPLVEPYYALRVYVSDDDYVYSGYVDQWSSLNTGDNSFILCKKSDPKPSLIYSYKKETGGTTLTGSYEVPINERNDVYVNPVHNFYDDIVTEWKFVSVDKQVSDNRINKKLGNKTDLPYTRQFNDETGRYDYILVMDYDIKLENV